ncbi:hydroxymethylglutaryl-CoA lyase [Sphingopyxis sp. SE2]|jgi:hydroxymethylglutaryl-CoA lyase|uniref:hydroxymethylglutaryl-CoA lyase n=1 Tax=unclassified Sphingopyxis TaxID=2614943 RepID=UPI0028C32540|nr:hydroxymethylglutaryl-CoA lyase [Sphingopyxis sp. SE2]MDT7529189.1 hydroxymethylglutaryl-CoA lyase [Sphingopyxis sp. SE2]
MSNIIEIVEVGPRDGFQSIGPLIPTKRKLELVDMLYDAGVRRMEATAFVSTSAVPQLADAGELLNHIADKPGLDAQVLVPSLRHAERALEAGARHLAFVLSVSEKHNRGNVRRSPAESVQEFSELVELVPIGTRLRLNMATAFDCPFDGPVPAEATLALLEPLVALAPKAEFCLCDTTGRVTPDRVASLFATAKAINPEAPRWAFHGHDTYGQGVSNAVAAWNAGISVIDSSFAGLGGCPFAPGATGNVATEDLVWTFTEMGLSTGIDLPRLIEAAREAAELPGASFGGRVRDALLARTRTAA